jgi:hypothetical protein
VEQRARYFNVLAALPEATVVLIADLIETSPLPADPFDRLKARLVTAHQLTDVQKVEKLLSFPTMGQQKPFELLAEMLRFCPREENSVFFNCLFLQKLPRELQVLLSEADMADKRLLSERTDQIWAHNSHLHHYTFFLQLSPASLTATARWLLYSPPKAVRVVAGAAGFLATGGGGEQLVAVVSRGVVASRRQLLHRGSWPGSPPGCARATGDTATTPSVVLTLPTASGRETRLPGEARCCRRRVISTHSGRELWHTIFGGHWRQFQYSASPFAGGGVGPTFVRPGWSTHRVLG